MRVPSDSTDAIAARASATDAAASSEICRASASSCSARRRSKREPSPSFSRMRSSAMIRSISRMLAACASSLSCSASSRATSVCASARSCHKRASRSASAAVSPPRPLAQARTRAEDWQRLFDLEKFGKSRAFAAVRHRRIRKERCAPPARAGSTSTPAESRAPARRHAESTRSTCESVSSCAWHVAAHSSAHSQPRSHPLEGRHRTSLFLGLDSAKQLRLYEGTKRPASRRSHDQRN